MMNNIIINADDFGISKEVNNAIMTAMDSQLCLDTTILVNFEDAEDAATLAISMNRMNHVGIHLNITEGIPLTKNIRNESRFCNSEGMFHNRKLGRIALLSKSEQKAIYEELKSQVQLCRKFGISISHADSHNHIHEEPGMLPILLRVLKDEKIPYLRLSNDIGKTSLHNKLYRNTYNYILKLKRLTATNHFGSISDFLNSKNTFTPGSVIELMIHPGKTEADQILDVYSKENLSLLLPKVLIYNKLVSYNQLSYKV